MCLNYTCIIFIFFNLRLHVLHVQFCCFRIGRSSTRNYRAFKKKSISYLMNIMYKHIFLNFGVISFINKEMVTLFQLHTYKQNSIESMEKVMRSSCESISEIKSKTQSHDKMLRLLNYKSLDLEARSRRKNLIFRGLFENRQEDCYELIQTFLVDQMHFDGPEVTIERAHRLGPRKDQRIHRRPIIVAFRDYADVELILNRAKFLRGTRFAVDKDFPKEISSARSLLWNRYKDLKSKYDNVSLQYPAKIIVGKRVVEDAFPGWQEAVKEVRVKPYISKEVESANEEAKKRWGNRDRLRQANLSQGTAQSDPSQMSGEGHIRGNTAQGGSNNTGATQNMTYRQARGSWGDDRDDWNDETSEKRPSHGNTNQSADDYMEHDKSTHDENDTAFYTDYVARMPQSQRPIESASNVHESAVDMSMREFPPLPSSPPDQYKGPLPGVSNSRGVNGNMNGNNTADRGQNSGSRDNPNMGHNSNVD